MLIEKMWIFTLFLERNLIYILIGVYVISRFYHSSVVINILVLVLLFLRDNSQKWGVRILWQRDTSTMEW